MDRFLRSNPGLASRFSTRVTFPSYQPADLVRIADLLAEQAGDMFDPAAKEVLGRHLRPRLRRRAGSTSWATAGSPGPCSSGPAPAGTSGWCGWASEATAADLTTLTAADVRDGVP